MFANGVRLQTIINTVAQVVSVPGSLNFGSHLVAEFASIIGLIRVDSVPDASARLRFDFQTDSGTTLITSALAVASGGIVVNEFNPAAHLNVSITDIVSSTAVRVFIAAVPLR